MPTTQRTRGDAKLEAMARLPLFAGCTKAELVRLGAHFEWSRLGPGVLFEAEGARSSWLWVIAQGSAMVTVAGRGHRVLIAGDCWGHEAVDRSSRVGHGTVTLEPTELFILRRADLSNVDRTAPRVAEAIRRCPPVLDGTENWVMAPSLVPAH